VGCWWATTAPARSPKSSARAEHRTLLFFVPERSRAFVLASTASDEVANKVKRVVEKCSAAADVLMPTTGYRHEVLIAAWAEGGEIEVA
jgi:hypothetical protein